MDANFQSVFAARVELACRACLAVAQGHTVCLCGQEMHKLESSGSQTCIKVRARAMHMHMPMVHWRSTDTIT
eukprot:4151318-Amphidinium_carterae.1